MFLPVLSTMNCFKNANIHLNWNMRSYTACSHRSLWVHQCLHCSKKNILQIYFFLASQIHLHRGLWSWQNEAQITGNRNNSDLEAFTDSVWRWQTGRKGGHRALRGSLQDRSSLAILTAKADSLCCVLWDHELWVSSLGAWVGKKKGGCVFAFLAAEDPKGTSMSQPYFESSVEFFSIEKEGSHVPD